MPRSIVRSTAAARLVLLVGLAVGLAACDTTSNVGGASAGGGETAPAATGALAEAAGLSDEQAASIREVLEGYRQQDPEPGLLWHAAREVRDRLTDEQAARLREAVGERRQARRSGRAPQAERPRPKRRRAWRTNARAGVADRLDLSEEQKEELRRVRAPYGEELRALRQKHRAGTFGPEDAERLREVRNEVRAAMRAVLTDDQQDRLDEMRAARAERREAVRAARAEALGLTDEQKAAVEAAFEEAVEGLRGGGPAVRPHGLRGAMRRQAREILTAEQRDVVLIHRLLVHRVSKERRAADGGPVGR
jgi:Spy/CpxP family protein refolding chaperone